MILSIGFVRPGDDSCNTAGISRAGGRAAVSTRNADDFPGCGIEVIDSWMRTAKLPHNHGWPAARKEKTIREHSDARRAEIQNLGNREPA